MMMLGMMVMNKINVEYLNKLKNILKVEEGYRQFPYLDTVGKTTIGYGFNLTDVGLSKAECDYILANRLVNIENQIVNRYEPYLNLDMVRKCVLLDMAYNLGTEGLMLFHDMLACLNAKNYTGAAEAMLSSLWAKQVGHRANFLATLMETGQGL